MTVCVAVERSTSGAMENSCPDHRRTPVRPPPWQLQPRCIAAESDGGSAICGAYVKATGTGLIDTLPEPAAGMTTAGHAQF